MAIYHPYRMLMFPDHPFRMLIIGGSGSGKKCIA